MSVTVGTSTSFDLPASTAPIAVPAETGSGLTIGGANSGAGPLLTFLVPAGLPPGTEIHVMATIPANFTGPDSPPLTAQLTLTTR